MFSTSYSTAKWRASLRRLSETPSGQFSISPLNYNTTPSLQKSQEQLTGVIDELIKSTQLECRLILAINRNKQIRDRKRVTFIAAKDTVS